MGEDNEDGALIVITVVVYFGGETGIIFQKQGEEFRGLWPAVNME